MSYHNCCQCQNQITTGIPEIQNTPVLQNYNYHHQNAASSGGGNYYGASNNENVHQNQLVHQNSPGNYFLNTFGLGGIGRIGRSVNDGYGENFGSFSQASGTSASPSSSYQTCNTNAYIYKLDDPGIFYILIKSAFGSYFLTIVSGLGFPYVLKGGFLWVFFGLKH